MLVFSRKRGEAIVIGDNVEVVVLSAGKEGLRIGVRAPQSIPVHRKEIYELIKEENRTAAQLALWRAEPGRPSLVYIRPRVERGATFRVDRVRQYAEDGYQAARDALDPHPRAGKLSG